MPAIPLNKIDLVVKEVLTKMGVCPENTEIISETILFAHRTGKGTHGITRLPIYVKKITNGSLNPANDFTIVKEKGGVTVIDAQNGFGQVAAYLAMEKAIQKAETYGVGVVGVRNSNNFGTAAYFLEMATKQQMIGVVMANSAPAIAPWGGRTAMFGTNPMGFGFPTANGVAPIIFDMATSFAARGKIRLAAKNNEKIPFGWALDSEGNPTDDPLKAIRGTLIPIGEHKGSGLSLVVDVLAGLLTGSAFAGNVKPLNTDGEFSRNGHFLLALNINFFMEYADYLARTHDLVKAYKQKHPFKELLYPGENACRNKLANVDTVEIGERPIEEINMLLRSLEIDCLL